MPNKQGSSSAHGKGSEKYGRNRMSCERYKNEHRTFFHKLKRVKQSCGEAYARKWEEQYRDF